MDYTRSQEQAIECVDGNLLMILQISSQPFAVRGYKRIAVKVVDVYGNESTIVRELR